MRHFLFFFLALFCANLQYGQETPTNIIIMIGDGTGLAQITAGMYANGNKTNLEAFPVIGLSKTHSSNALVTDSAASGTAMACGVKTENGVIGISAKNEPVSSILELSKKKAYKTGLIATSSIVHATPASFYANVISRKKYEDIALQLSNSDVDYFIAGGKKHFTQRTDERNLLKEMTQWEFPNSLKSFNKATKDRVGYFISDEEPLTIQEGRKPSLQAATQSMLKKLTQNDQPFFLMVEGSQIDWGGHANDLDYIISEFIDFDKAIGEMIAFVERHPNTLLIVTADHETGGLGLSEGDVKSFTPKGKFVTGGHTANMVPVFAMGMGAEAFAGIYDNTSIFDKMLMVLSKN